MLLRREKNCNIVQHENVKNVMKKMKKVIFFVKEVELGIGLGGSWGKFSWLLKNI
jgi:hypothetical protein